MIKRVIIFHQSKYIQTLFYLLSQLPSIKIISSCGSFHCSKFKFKTWPFIIIFLTKINIWKQAALFSPLQSSFLLVAPLYPSPHSEKNLTCSQIKRRRTYLLPLIAFGNLRLKYQWFWSFSWTQEEKEEGKFWKQKWRGKKINNQESGSDKNLNKTNKHH